MPHASLLFFGQNLYFLLLVIQGLRLPRTNFILDSLGLGSEILYMVAHESAWDMSWICRFGFSGLPHFLHPQNQHRAKILPSSLHGHIVFHVFAACRRQPFTVFTLARIFRISIVSMFMWVLFFILGWILNFKFQASVTDTVLHSRGGNTGDILLQFMFFILVPGNFSFLSPLPFP